MRSDDYILAACKLLLMNETKEIHDAIQSCLKVLIELKWGDGYHCRKCQHGNWVKGRTWYYRRCGSCRYDESAIAHTPLQGKRLTKQSWLLSLRDQSFEEQLKIVREHIVK
ncbi:MAG TPA: hypothetical protein PK798_08425 [Flavobacteriales bacterium]|nr:hypothetical protein [Flavobacteriales bacterium]HRJ38801.1 hypothetical protein [Flavobacteriales bacterium]